MRAEEKTYEQPDNAKDMADSKKRTFVEPKLTFVEPELVKHGDLVHVTGFFGTFSP